MLQIPRPQGLLGLGGMGLDARCEKYTIASGHTHRAWDLQWEAPRGSPFGGQMQLPWKEADRGEVLCLDVD